MKVCIEEDCNEYPYLRGMCRYHYFRWTKSPDFIKVQRHGEHSKVILENEYAKLELTKGEWALIDTDDIEKVKIYLWSYSNGYAVRSGNSSLYLHQLIMGIQEGKEVDHINRNKLDCRKENMRLVSHAENTYNRGAEVRGTIRVWINKKYKYRAQMKQYGRSVNLGNYDTEEEAHQVYIAAREKFHGSN